MTAEDFRRLALSLPEVEERPHMEHPDFRVRGKIFATLGYPDDEWGMVKLEPWKQGELVGARPAVFVPAKGKWGLQGATCIRLANADEAEVLQAIRLAWSKTAPATLARSVR